MMKFGTSLLFISFPDSFVATLDKWKELIVREGLKSRLTKLIQEDLKNLEKK